MRLQTHEAGRRIGHRIAVIGAEIVTTDNLAVRETAAAQQRMRIVNARINHGDSYACAVINLTYLQSTGQIDRLPQHRLNNTNRFDMRHSRIGKQLAKAVHRHRTGQRREVLVCVLRCELNRSKR